MGEKTHVEMMARARTWLSGQKWKLEKHTDLAEAGYDTTLVGKAHFQPLKSVPGSESIECQPVLRDLDFWRGFHGPWYGFDHLETARMHGNESHVGNVRRYNPPQLRRLNRGIRASPLRPIAP